MFWKAVGALAAATAAVVGVRMYKEHEAQALNEAAAAGTVYAVKLRFKGAGTGGPITIEQIQTMLDNVFGKSSLEVGSSVTDSSKKTITYLVAVALPTNVKGAGLSAVPAPWAPGILEQFEPVGTVSQGLTLGAPSITTTGTAAA